MEESDASKQSSIQKVSINFLQKLLGELVVDLRRKTLEF